MNKPDDLIWRFRSLHYGFTDPTATLCLWWEVHPDNTLHVRAELRLQKLTIELITQEIAAFTRKLGIKEIRYTVADEENIGKESGDGETIADTFASNKMRLLVMKPDPIHGWTRLRELLGPRPDGRIWLTIDPSCKYLIKALASAMQDKGNPEDVMATDNDQPLRALRIGAMSRPAPKIAEKPKLPPNAVGHLVDEIRGGSSGNSLEWK